MTTYAIETYSKHEKRWVTVKNGRQFKSRSDAERAVNSLRDLGDDWADAKYRVVEE